MSKAATDICMEVSKAAANVSVDVSKAAMDVSNTATDMSVDVSKAAVEMSKDCRLSHAPLSSSPLCWWFKSQCMLEKPAQPCHIHAYTVYTPIGGKGRCRTSCDLQDHSTQARKSAGKIFTLDFETHEEGHTKSKTGAISDSTKWTLVQTKILKKNLHSQNGKCNS